jgi:alkylation response protein AidB-like acyl-CoA dehydrogenase
MATDFAKQKILPFASEWDQKHHFPYEVVKESAQYGFGGIYTSPDYGGCGLGRMEAALVF